MTTLLDRNGKLCGYLYNNKILSAGSFEVIGVILGDCVFGKHGDIKGKHFNKTIYSIAGEIIACEQVSYDIPAFDPIEVLFQGWSVVEKIKDHECPWIDPLQKWHVLSLENFLSQAGAVTLVRRTGKKMLQ